MAYFFSCNKNAMTYAFDLLFYQKIFELILLFQISRSKCVLRENIAGDTFTSLKPSRFQDDGIADFAA